MTKAGIILWNKDDAITINPTIPTTFTPMNQQSPRFR